MNRILFCNIASMNFYDFDTQNDKPINGGSYVANSGNAYEKINFHDFGDSFCYGFVETGRTLHQPARKIQLERIDPAATNASHLDHVMVVFCTKSSLLGMTDIVGWYRDATVFREQKQLPSSFENETLYYCFRTKTENAFLVPKSERKPLVPRRNKNAVGFGQSNIWFAQEEAAKDLRKAVLCYINGSDSPEYYDTEDEILFRESGDARRFSVSARTRNRNAREECLKRKGTSCMICGWNAARIYGKDYIRVIEVHHIKPISSRTGEYDIDPDRDLMPVCPSCHRILHSKKADGSFPTVQELQARF